MKIFKPTSIIFMIISAVLIIAGVVLCVIGGSMAKKQDVKLFAEDVDKDGNSIWQRNLTSGTMKSITIDLGGGSVKIIGGASKSEIILKNYALNSFEFSTAGNDVELKTASLATPFKFISSSGSNFHGLRHYLVMNRYKDEDKVVEIYLTKGTNNLEDIDIKLKNGDVSVTDLDLNCKCRISVEKGNVSVINSSSDDEYQIDVKDGNVDYYSDEIHSSKVNIKNSGNINCYIDTQYSFTLESGNEIFVKDENIGKKYVDLCPSQPIEKEEPEETKEPEETNESDETGEEVPEKKTLLPMGFKGKTADGFITVKIIEN